MNAKQRRTKKRAPKRIEFKQKLAANKTKKEGTK